MLRSTSLAVFRLILLMWLTAFIIVVQGAALALRANISRWLPKVWLGWCRHAIGMDVFVTGGALVEGPALFVSNHISYLDIIAIGSVIDGSFVSRADVRHWPVVGFLATLQRTVFIERNPRHARQHREELTLRLSSGDRLILFPEGTSSDGTTILPFKSSLFSAAELEANECPVPVQPISIAYTRLDGLPLGRLMRPLYAWYGDMHFAPHFWQLLGLGRFKVEIIVHDAVTLEGFSSRKELALYCERTITNGFSRSIAGRADNPRARVSPGDAATPA
jgi:1-acyl-sn-glycerol-3-phosphate acyltransferase